jgi:hypothetical protein
VIVVFCVFEEEAIFWTQIGNGVDGFDLRLESVEVAIMLEC